MTMSNKTYSSSEYYFIEIDNDYISFKSLLNIVDIKRIDINLILMNNKCESINNINFSNLAYGDYCEAFIDKSYVIRLSENANKKIIQIIKDTNLEAETVATDNAVFELNVDQNIEAINILFKNIYFFRAKELEDCNVYYDTTLVGFFKDDIISLEDTDNTNIEKYIIPILKNTFEFEAERFAEEEKQMEKTRAKEIQEYNFHRDLYNESDSWMDDPENYWNID